MTKYEKVLLIVPCYNEAKRLNIQDFKDSRHDFIFANDGSNDGTLKLLKSFRDENQFFVHSSSVNKGKAKIIQSAYQSIKENGLIHKYQWIGYWDADLATPLFEIDNMLNFSHGHDAVWGSRVSRLGSNIKRSAIRHYLGRVFVTITSLVFQIESYDSQCGAKIFKKNLFAKAFDKPLYSNWIFDVEILLRLKGERIVEYPLTQWSDIPKSKITVLRVLPSVIADIIRLWRLY